jgi:hypothetical protein
VLVIASTICKPIFLAHNSFLDKFAGEGAIALLAVILTVTLASVANIHVAINRIVLKGFKDDIEKGRKAAMPARKEINENAWLLLIVFVLSIILVFVKEIDPSQIYIKSLVNGSVLIFLLINALVLYDIYKVVFKLSEEELNF